MGLLNILLPPIKVFLRQSWRFLGLNYQLFAKALFFILWLGCNRPQEAGETPLPARPSGEPPSSVKPQIAARGPDVAQDIYDLRPVGVDSYRAGKLGKFSVILTPRGAYHINQEYPTSITLKTPVGLSLSKSRFLKSDALEFNEKIAKFEVTFTPEKAGVYATEVKASFAMCTSKTCIPLDKTLAVTLSVD